MSAPAVWLELDVEGMHCAACELKVRAAAEGVVGVEAVTVDRSIGRIRASGCASVEAVATAIKQAGYLARPSPTGQTLAQSRLAADREAARRELIWRRRATLGPPKPQNPWQSKKERKHYEKKMKTSKR